MTDQTSTTQIAPTPPAPTGPAALITLPSQYLEALKRWQESGFHVLTPFANLSGLADRHALIATMVKINTNASYEGQGGDGETYGGLPFLKGKRGQPDEELAIAKLGLRKIAECGAITTRTYRTDDRTIPYYWEFKAIASYRAIDGTIVVREATAEWDLRDGSPRLKGWRPAQIEESRKTGLRNCETRAINAAIREFGIKQKYTRKELEKPFVIVRVAYQPDMSDPVTRRAVVESSLAGTAALYPSAGRALPDIIDVEPESSVVTKGPKGGQAEEPAQNELDDLPTVEAPTPPPAAAVLPHYHITFVGRRDKDPKVYVVRTQEMNGRELETRESEIALAAKHAKESGVAVDLDFERTEDGGREIWVLTALTLPQAELPL